MTRHVFILAVFSALWLIGVPPGGADSEILRVVASIPPIHSLAAGVMEGAGSPALLVRGGASPHVFSLRPSSARALQEARLVFWAGEGAEDFLIRPLAILARKGRIVTLSKTPGLSLYPARPAGDWAGRTLARRALPGRTRAEGRIRGKPSWPRPGGPDMHIWLDPRNARVIVHAMAVELSRADRAGRALYIANAKRLTRRLEALEAEIRATLAPARRSPYVVFHDAYRYFEERFGLRPAGAFAAASGRKPGARRLTELRRRIRALGAVCVFAEPQFKPSLLETMMEGTGARAGVLDPLGADFEPGPELYFSLMRGLAASLRACLAPPTGG
ncbi:MAG TPA: zinc ABC transporter substrate-binding protein [Nitrospinae bacterium]|nr:zinc ABC transporter substrate-binding protein [Nitrospinota bacterium]